MGDWGTPSPARVVGIDLKAASVDVAIAAPHRSIRAGRGAVAFHENLGRSLSRRGHAS
jgi:kynureninase